MADQLWRLTTLLFSKSENISQLQCTGGTNIAAEPLQVLLADTIWTGLSEQSEVKVFAMINFEALCRKMI